MVVPRTGPEVGGGGAASPVSRLAWQVVTVQVRVDVPELAVEPVALIQTDNRMGSGHPAPEHPDTLEAHWAVDGEAVEGPSYLWTVSRPGEVQLEQQTRGQETVVIASVRPRTAPADVYGGRHAGLPRRLPLDQNSVESHSNNGVGGQDVSVIGGHMGEQRNLKRRVEDLSQSDAVSSAVGLLA